MNLVTTRRIDASNIIAVLALLVSITSIPISYWVAQRQVRLGIEEQSRREERTCRLRVANNLDEFNSVFRGAVETVARINPDELDQHLDDVNSKMAEIDELVRKTHVLDRLASSIGSLQDAGFPGLPDNSDVIVTLQSVRNLIAIGSDGERLVTVSVAQVLATNHNPAELVTIIRPVE